MYERILQMRLVKYRVIIGSHAYCAINGETFWLLWKHERPGYNKT
jgi:hypothetical protein